MGSSQIDIKKTKRSGVIGATILFLLATMHIFKGNLTTGVVLYAVSSIIFSLVVFFTLAFIKVTNLIGMFIAQLLLTIIFYLVLTPVGIIMRLFGNDPLDKKIDTNKDSYWIKKDETIESLTNYEKQF